MRNKFRALFVVLAFLGGVQQVAAQLPVITSFSQNGQLVCANLETGTVASVEWASSLSGPWNTNWAGLDAVTVGSNGTITVGVPMFFRVRGVAAYPAGMTLIPDGSFTMGDTLDGGVPNYDNFPTNVTVSAFYMDVTLVSFSQWQTVYNWATNHGYVFDHAGAGNATNQPVQSVDWFDAVKWSNARSQQAGLTPVYYTDPGMTQVYTNGDVAVTNVNWSANGYRLPTEAEWEKAARGGLSGQRFPLGNIISETNANYYGNTGYSYDLGPNGYNSIGNSGTTPVEYFAPNGYGLYDMAGDVSVWCWDWYGTPYGQPSTNNPTGPATGSLRVVRGGNWGSDASTVRCAARSGGSVNAGVNYIGFRCVRGR